MYMPILVGRQPSGPHSEFKVVQVTPEIRVSMRMDDIALRSVKVGYGNIQAPSKIAGQDKAEDIQMRRQLRTTVPPARQTISQWQQPHRPRVALVDVTGADELGSAITSPQIEPDADLDADEADTDNEGRCGTVSRGPGRSDFGGTGGHARQEGDGAIMGRGAREGANSIGWGRGQDWSEGRGGERTGDMSISILSLPLGVLPARLVLELLWAELEVN
ncbi:hypothetical protein B0H13DRAFT_1927093 [Mycena leptocephala]|nr:hypothetical protein B0H13DRAFT_1927093 [Mycena leptocephala]